MYQQKINSSKLGRTIEYIFEVEPQVGSRRTLWSMDIFQLDFGQLIVCSGVDIINNIFPIIVKDLKIFGSFAL